jgi:hypothetical protein
MREARFSFWMDGEQYDVYVEPEKQAGGHLACYCWPADNCANRFEMSLITFDHSGAALSKGDMNNPKEMAFQSVLVKELRFWLQSANHLRL